MFDPLHKWLGIPPSEQPPSYYRLLGLATFEADPDVIDAAADKHLAFLHDLTNGEYAEMAEQLSNQVSSARLCLLNEEKRRIYDDSLRNKPSTMLPTPASAEPSYQVPPPQPVSPATSTTPHRSRGRVKKQSKPNYWIYSMIPCLIALAMIGAGVWSGKFVLDYSRLKPLGIEIATSEPSPDALVDPTAEQKKQDEAAVEISDEATPPNRDTKERVETPQPALELTDSMGDEPSSLPELAPPANNDQPKADKHPLPSDSELEQKRALIRELYQDEYVKAKTSLQKVELGKLLHREGQSTTDDPAGRFELWRISHDILTKEGEFALALAIVDNFHDHYNSIDATTLKTETLHDAAPRITSDRTPEFIRAVGKVIELCRRDEKFAMGLKLVETSKREIGANARGSSREELEHIANELQQIANAFEQYQQSLPILTGTKNDPEANQRVGHYLCLIRRQWEQGLKHLTLGTDAKMRAAAVMEIASRTSSGNSLAIADAWHEVANSATSDSPASTNAKLHALGWYQRATSETKGLEQKKANVRIAELTETLPQELIADTEGDTAEPNGVVLAHRIKHSLASRSDFATRRGNAFQIGMGSRPDGMGEAMGGIELQGVKKVIISGGASHEQILTIDTASKTGFYVDYHTPGGYAKRVFLGLGMKPGRVFNESPPWGTEKKPEVITDIGKSTSYEIDLTRWAPSTWDGRCWFTIYMQNGGRDRSLNATVSWTAN
ncbi:MAG: hypothetical protein AB8B91_10955 [Rubripirellula sp.]